MNIAEARESITSLLEDVHSRSGILTNAYVDEVRVKIATTASMLPVESRAEFVEPMRDALGILDSIQSNNSNEVMHQHVGAGVALAAPVRNLAEDPMWLQRVEALEHSLGHYGISFQRLGNGSVKVTALAPRKDFPIGGTPKEVLVRNIPAKLDLELNEKKAKTILLALGRDARKFTFVETLRKIVEDHKRRVIDVTRLELINVLDALFASGPEHGWSLRTDILDDYGIQEA